MCIYCFPSKVMTEDNLKISSSSAGDCDRQEVRSEHHNLHTFTTRGNAQAVLTLH